MCMKFFSVNKEINKTKIRHMKNIEYISGYQDLNEQTKNLNTSSNIYILEILKNT